MSIQEHQSLASHTTLGLGGPARFFIEAHTESEIEEAAHVAHEKHVPLRVIGAGSNVLVPDAGVSGVVLHVTLDSITSEYGTDALTIVGGAGARWDAVVDVATSGDVYGCENLAGIPGSLGGAVVQNIGAYGAELSALFLYADTIDSKTGVKQRIEKGDAAFAYRTSLFKSHPELIITQVALRLMKPGAPNISYPDLVRANEEGALLDTPAHIASAVRAIRARKFPKPGEAGTAGSFFKNPIVSEDVYAVLKTMHPDLPGFPQANGGVKVPLAWILDHVLSLKGFRMGNVGLYEKQPLVLVTTPGATAREVDAFANDIAVRVFTATGITIEREVETFTF